MLGKSFFLQRICVCWHFNTSFQTCTMTVIGLLCLELQQNRVLIGPLASRFRRVIGFDWSVGFRVSRDEQLLLMRWLMIPRRNVLLKKQNQFIYSYNFPLESYLILCVSTWSHLDDRSECLNCSSLKNNILS